jgi:hypothetical protein
VVLIEGLTGDVSGGYGEAIPRRRPIRPVPEKFTPRLQPPALFRASSDSTLDVSTPDRRPAMKRVAILVLGGVILGGCARTMGDGMMQTDKW